jgi:S1-C subfamily serine protease
VGPECFRLTIFPDQLLNFYPKKWKQIMKNNVVPHNSVARGRSSLLLFLITFLAFAGGLLSASYLIGLAQSISPSLEGQAVVKAYGEELAGVYEKVLPSVVRIEVSRPSESPEETVASILTIPISPRPVSLSKGQGSGFVWDKAGHIVTNLHVVQGAKYIEVVFAGGVQTKAELLGTDLSTDLAVLEVDLLPDQLHPIILGDSTNLKVGQLALAIGAPFGQEFTMTSGIISALNRIMHGCDSCYPIAEVIQTDIAINPGNSGGPLLNERGEVIGVNTWIISRSGGSSGISFALSSKAMEQIIPTLISNGSSD